MKTIIKSLAFVALLAVFSCSSDDSPSSDSGQNDDQIAEELENTPIEANTIADNVIIAGGTQNSGTPPTPNEAISLDVSNAGSMALLNEGFTIPLSSDAAITGAYLQFKANDGTMADNYYDINIAQNKSNKQKAGKTGPAFVQKGIQTSLKVEETILDVDFNTLIEPGTFCYVICVYDAEGNISAPQEVCVTVESWGGNSDMVGVWEMVKEEETTSEGVVTLLLGEEDCDEGTITCDNGGVLNTIVDCYTIEKHKMTLNTDGTYVYQFEEPGRYLNRVQTKASCEAVFEDDSYSYYSEGQWSYIDETNGLILVEYKYTIKNSDDLLEETLQAGDAEWVFDGEAQVNGNEMIAVQGDYRIFFEK